MNREKKRLTYYLQEWKKWQTAIRTMQLENDSLKDRLSEAMRLNPEYLFVEEAEYFQQKFIEKDIVINLLRQEIHHWRDQISGAENEVASEQQFLRLEKDLEKMIFEFHRMKVSFANFLSYR